MSTQPKKTPLFWPCACCTDLTPCELAQDLGVSVGGLNYCLKALIDKGWVKMQNFSQSKIKFGNVYIFTPTGIAEKVALTSRLLRHKMSEYEALKAEIQEIQNEADIPLLRLAER